MLLTLEEIRKRLNGVNPSRIGNDALMRAAVLVPIFRKGGDWHVLFTKRSSELPHHPGEVSFPGGALDEGEKAVEAALRETYEEVGVDPTCVDVLGRLDDTFSIAGFRVSPFVGTIPYPYEFTVSEQEIEDVFDVAVSRLTDPRHYRRGQWMAENSPRALHFFEGGKHTIWGLTARVLAQFLDVVFDWKPPERDD